MANIGKQVVTYVTYGVGSAVSALIAADVGINTMFRHEAMDFYRQPSE